jgi:hypothetical protein
MDTNNEVNLPSIAAITIIGLLLLLGAMAKSANLGLHTWLPDAMEGTNNEVNLPSIASGSHVCRPRLALLAIAPSRSNNPTHGYLMRWRVNLPRYLYPLCFPSILICF